MPSARLHFDAGLHHGALLGQFAILWFPLDGNGQETEPPTVHVDGFNGGHRAVRDSKDPTGPALTCTAAEWSAFTAGIRADELG
jgi:hypothetical protein